MKFDAIHHMLSSNEIQIFSSCLPHIPKTSAANANTFVVF